MTVIAYMLLNIVLFVLFKCIKNTRYEEMMINLGIRKNERITCIIGASFILAIIPMVRIFNTIAVLACITISDEEFNDVLTKTIEKSE